MLSPAPRLELSTFSQRHTPFGFLKLFPQFPGERKVDPRPMADDPPREAAPGVPATPAPVATEELNLAKHLSQGTYPLARAPANVFS